MNRTKKRIRIIIDIAMPVLLITVMAYQLIGRAYHEYAGVAMLVLFSAHNYLNIKWYKALFKGKYSAYRILSTIVNLAAFAAVLLTIISGVSMSGYIFKDLDIGFSSYYARLIHLSLSYWSYVLMSFHLGMHLGRILDRRNPVFLFILSAFSLYGLYAFFSRKIGEYMLLISRFAFFRSDETIIKFVFDYIAIMLLFSMAGYAAAKEVKGNKP